MRGAGLLIVGCLMLMPAAASGAQAPADPGGAPPSAGRPGRAGRPPLPPADAMNVQQVEEYFDAVVLYQAQAQLRLTDEQFLRFGARLQRLQAIRRQAQRRRTMLIRDLNQLLASGAEDQAALGTKVQELDALTAESARQEADAYAAIDQVLDVRQRARFRVFEQMMDRRKLDLLARARQAGRGR
jgi:hypothetical protein